MKWECLFIGKGKSVHLQRAFVGINVGIHQKQMCVSDGGVG